MVKQSEKRLSTDPL